MGAEPASHHADSGQGVPSGGVRAPRRTAVRWPLILSGTLVAALLLSALAFPGEVARWYLAAALEAYTEGDVAAALSHVDRAIAWDPHSSRLYQFRTLVYQRLGRHADAVRDWNIIVEAVRKQHARHPEPTRYELAQSLNNRAYARALGQIEIDRGLADIQEAFEILGTEDVSYMLDTRGYLRHLAGADLQAKSDLQRAIQLAQSSATSGLGKAPDTLRPDGGLVLDGQTVRELAVLYHHRGLIHRRLGESREAEADLELAERLGYGPENGVW